MKEFFGIKVNAGTVKSMTKLVNAILVVMRDRPYAEVSVTEICETAGVTRKTFYAHFDCKRDLIECALDTMFLELTKKFDFGEAEAIDVIKYAYDYLYTSRDLAHAFTDPDLFEVFAEKVKGYIEIVFDDVLYNAASFETAFVEYYHAFMAVGIVELVKKWVMDGYKQSPKIMASLTKRLLSGVMT